jgi:BirA family biotin operon repressor/biotin-[acetyl-CoA-carboxylase] ligase
MCADFAIYEFDVLSSTQDKAKEYLKAETYSLPFAILAKSQTAGRGRGGNQWVSPQGNLYTSLVPKIGRIFVRNAGQFSFVTAVALMSCLSFFGVNNPRNKWPNDIFVDGKKIAGILLESDVTADGVLSSLIIGVGVNLQSAPEGAVSLFSLLHHTIPPLEFLEKFSEQLQVFLNIMASQGFLPIRKAWLDNAYGMGAEIRVRLPRETFFGEFVGLDKDGALLVRVNGENAPRIIYSGDVFFDQKEMN